MIDLFFSPQEGLIYTAHENLENYLKEPIEPFDIWLKDNYDLSEFQYAECDGKAYHEEYQDLFYTEEHYLIYKNEKQ